MLCILEKPQLSLAAELYANVYNVNNIAAIAVLESFAEVVLAQKDDTGINAILCATKFKLGNSVAVLLHGAACKKDTQHSDFKALVQYAKASLKADNFIITQANILDNPSQDMDNHVNVRMITRDIKRNLWAKAEFDTITARKLCQYRNMYIKEPFAQLTVEQSGALLTSLYSQGISSAETNKAYALYFRTADNLNVVELYAQTDVDAWFLLEAMADREGRNKAQLILSENNTIFAGEGKRVHYASYDNAQIENNNIYIGPMPK